MRQMDYETEEQGMRVRKMSDKDSIKRFHRPVEMTRREKELRTRSETLPPFSEVQTELSQMVSYPKGSKQANILRRFRQGRITREQMERLMRQASTNPSSTPGGKDEP